jgi:ABC-type sugar transport system ATPase subunit
MREIKALAASGHGVLFNTHDPNHALRAAHRAFLLRDGTRIAEGRVADVSTARKWKRSMVRRSSNWPIPTLAVWRFCPADVYLAGTTSE